MATHSFPIQKLDQLHHAYILEGDSVAARTALFDFLNKECGMKMGHADLFLFSAESFGVDDARLLTEANMRKPVFGKKFLIAEFSGITIPAQNSLLKTIEEPASNTFIFLIIPTASVFLPTVLSRVHVLNFKDEAANVTPISKEGFNAKKEATRFASSTPAERMEIIKKLMAEKERETIGDAEIFQLAREIEILAHAKVSDKIKLKGLSVVDEYIRDTSSSKKMLLEYLALTLPVV